MLNLDDEQKLLKPLVTNTHDNLNRIISKESLRPGHLLIKGRNDPTTFLPLSTNIGGHVNCNKSKDNQYLAE